MNLWIYRHYKWKLYEVLYVAIHSELLQEMVVYKALYDHDLYWDNSIWVRPKDMFLESVEINWKSLPRFEYVWNKKYENV